MVCTSASHSTGACGKPYVPLVRGVVTPQASAPLSAQRSPGNAQSSQCVESPQPPHAAGEDRSSALRFETGSHTLAGDKYDIPDWENQDSSLVLWLTQTLLLVCAFDGHGDNGHLIAE